MEDEKVIELPKESIMTPELAEAIDTDPNKLTPEQVSMIDNAIQEVVDSNENLKAISEMPSNNGVEYHTPEQGELLTGKIAINPETGEKAVIDVVEEAPKTVEQKISELGESLDTDFNLDNISIEAEDIKGSFSGGVMGSESGFEISDEAALQLVNIVAKYKETGKIRYADMPDEVKAYIDKFLANEGLIAKNNETNAIRNTITETIIDSMISNIELEKYNSEFQSKMEDIFADVSNEVSPLFMDYNNSREEYLNKLSENIEDEEKKKKAEDIIDAIHDSFALERIIESAPKFKIKPIELEKPETRVFSKIHSKYMDNKFHIYNLEMITGVLDLHLKKNNIIPEDDKTTALKVIIIFAKHCANYDINIPDQHAFMYYFTYNVVLLNVYKGEQYDKYAPEFLGNIKKIIDNFRK